MLSGFIGMSSRWAW